MGNALQAVLQNTTCFARGLYNNFGVLVTVNPMKGVSHNFFLSFIEIQYISPNYNPWVNLRYPRGSPRWCAGSRTPWRRWSPSR